jgi:hypothetical protein
MSKFAHSGQSPVPSQTWLEAHPDAPEIHKTLAHWNHRRLAPASPHDQWEEDLEEEHDMRLAEGRWVEALRRAVRAQAQAAPTDVDGFTDWFIALKKTGPGQNDPLFGWLAEEATAEEMNWFLNQEAAGEAGFDDLVALTQVKLPAEAKLELARNYWDEMGRGNMKGMHGPMLERAVTALDLRPRIDTTVWQSLALANTLTAFATTRRYAWHAVGALGVVEFTAPSRVAMVARGLRRLEHPPVVRKYFDLHAVLDLKHADDWIANCLRPLVRDNPGVVQYLAEGALMRLLCGQRCFEAYRSHFGLHVA